MGVAIKNDGCAHADTCFECPLPDCSPISRDVGAAQLRRSRRRHAREMRAAGHSIPTIAARFGISTRTVQRMLRGR